MPSSMLPGEMLPADGGELPRARREPEEVGVNSVVSQPVSVGRSRRPQGELNRDANPG